MGQLRKLAKHSSHYFIGRMCIILLGFISFPVFTRLLSVEQYGLLNLVTAVLFTCTAFAKMGMQQAVQRFHGENAGSPGAFRRYYSTLFFGTAGIGAVTVVAYLVVVSLALPRFLGGELKYLLVIACALIFIRALQSMVTNLLQVEGKTLAFNGLEFLVKALTIAAVVALLLKWQPTTRAYVLGMVAVEALALLATVPYLLRRHLLLAQSFDSKFLWTAFSFGAPLMWAEMCAYVLDSGDRVLVQYFLGSTSLGYYSAAYGIAQYAREVLVIPVSLALFPLCMETWNKQGREGTQQFLSQSLRYYFAVAIGLLCVLALTSRDLLVILASEKYIEAYTLLPVLLAGLVIASLQLFARIGLLIQRRPAMIVKATAWAIGVNVALNLVLLPRMGTMGAAVATLVSYVVQVVLMARESMRFLPVKIEYGMILKYLLAAGVVVATGLQVHLGDHWLQLFARTGIGMGYLVLLLVLDPEARRAAKRVLRYAEKVTPVPKAEIEVADR